VFRGKNVEEGLIGEKSGAKLPQHPTIKALACRCAEAGPRMHGKDYLER